MVDLASHMLSHTVCCSDCPRVWPLSTYSDRGVSRQVLRRLDNIDEGVRQFFLPASKLVLESGDPEDALSRALAALSGLVEVPKPRR